MSKILIKSRKNVVRAGAQDAQPRIGPTLRDLRNARGLSMKELAETAGVSAGMISQIERGTANPSIKILDKLRTALGVPLSSLLEKPSSGLVRSNGSIKVTSNGTDPFFVRRFADRPKFNVGAVPLSKELLSPSGAEGMQFMVIHFPPLARSDDILVGPGLKAGVVLSGEVVITVDDVEATLGPGDSFQFDSSRPHGIRNAIDEESQVLWIMGTFRPAHF